jgi:alkane 1-monooxygenase
MERALTRPALGRHAARLHAYVLCLGGYALLCILAAAVFGAGGLLVLLALSALAQAQAHAGDYLRRYGLARRTPPARRPRAPGPELSWDAPRAFAAAAASRTRAGAPCYPWPWPAMALAALVPPLWRRLTDPALLRLAATRRSAAPAAAPRPVPARAPRAARPPRPERTRA